MAAAPRAEFLKALLVVRCTPEEGEVKAPEVETAISPAKSVSYVEGCDLDQRVADRSIYWSIRQLAATMLMFLLPRSPSTRYGDLWEWRAFPTR